MSNNYLATYHPDLILKDPAFKVFSEATVPYDKEQNLSIAYNAHKQIQLVQRPRPVPREGEVVVHIRATGICGSDVHFWKHGHIGSMMVENEVCAGHESAGEIVELGPGVDAKEWSVGDRVAVEAGVPCGDCELCRVGKYNACPDVVFFSTPPHHGTLTRYHLHPVKWLHRLPDAVSYEEGALLEPLVVALAGLERCNIGLGDPLLICGAGPIGLVTLLAAHAAGATPIVLTDLSESRLKFAVTLVTSVRTVAVARGDSSMEVSKQIRAAAALGKDRHGVDKGLSNAIECSGFESSIQAAIYSLRFGGKVMGIGLGNDMINIPFMYMSGNEIDLSLLFRYANCYPRAIRLVAAGLINLKPLVTHRFTLEESVKAFETAADIRSGSIKCQILDKAF